MLKINEVVAICPECNTECHFPIYQSDMYNSARCWPGHCVKCRAPFVIVLKPLECMTCNPSRDCTCLEVGRRVLEKCE